MLNRAVIATGRDLARAKAAANALYSPTGSAPADPSNWRGDHGLRAADRILAQALQTRTIVSPDMENGDATVGDGSPEQEMEPFDPTISPRQAEDEEEEPTDEEERQAEDEEEDEEEMALEAAGVDITIIDVEEENSDREDEPV
jgi:hypothetical protein